MPAPPPWCAGFVIPRARRTRRMPCRPAPRHTHVGATPGPPDVGWASGSRVLPDDLHRAAVDALGATHDLHTVGDEAGCVRALLGGDLA